MQNNQPYIGRTTQIVIPTAITLLLLMGLLMAFAQDEDNHPPFVSNVNAEQRPGTKLVDITYDVSDPDGDLLRITVTVSGDGGETFMVTVQSFTGDVGDGIAPGTGKKIVWDAGADVPNIFGTNYQVKVTANDGRAGGATVIGRDGAPMVLIPAGEFEMGDSKNDPEDWMKHSRPVHTVYVDAFYMDVYEVTNAQYKKFMDATGHSAPRFWNDARFNQPEHPVVGVNWYDSGAYAQWAGKRLPTEAEWEKAARGGLVGKRYPWGDEAPDAGGTYRANYDPGNDAADGYAFTAPVGSFPPNGYGLYDMAGNVWEWCMDEWDSGFYARSPRENPVAGGLISFVNNNFTNVTTNRVIRGGGWDDYPYGLRVADRLSYSPDYSDYWLGFRCATVLLCLSSFIPLPLPARSADRIFLYVMRGLLRYKGVIPPILRYKGVTTL